MYRIRRCVYELFLIELLSIKYWCVSILTLTFIRLACQRKSKINEALFFFASQNWNIALSSVFSCFPIPVLCLCWNNNIVCLMFIHSWVCNGLRKDNIQVFYDIGFIREFHYHIFHFVIIILSTIFFSGAVHVSLHYIYLVLAVCFLLRFTRILLLRRPTTRN